MKFSSCKTHTLSSSVCSVMWCTAFFIMGLQRMVVFDLTHCCCHKRLFCSHLGGPFLLVPLTLLIWSEFVYLWVLRIRFLGSGLNKELRWAQLGSCISKCGSLEGEWERTCSWSVNIHPAVESLACRVDYAIVPLLFFFLLFFVSSKTVFSRVCSFQWHRIDTLCIFLAA